MSVVGRNKVLHFGRGGIFQLVATNEVFRYLVLLGVGGLAIGNRDRPVAIHGSGTVC